MKKTILLLIAITIGVSSITLAQTLVQGKIIDIFNEPLPGANIYILGSYDGTTSDANGDFHFSTDKTPPFDVKITYIGYKDQQVHIQSNDPKLLTVKMQENASTLQNVVVTPGSFVTSDKVKAAQLKPLDIVTTAGALGDINGALTTLPGTSVVGESGRLFVRGGDDNEAAIFIDGNRVHRPYGSSVPNIGTRGRYSPFLFRGTFFSTGGYSAEYGQAMSSTLNLETKVLPQSAETNLSIMAVGLEAGHSRKMEKDELHVETGYYNLAPLFKLIPQNYDWIDAPEGYNALAFYRRNISSKHQFQVLSSLQGQKLKIARPLADGTFVSGVKNENFYINIKDIGTLQNNWDYTLGISYTHNYDALSLDSLEQSEYENDWSATVKVEKRMKNESLLKAGAEALSFHRKYNTDISPSTFNVYAAFTEFQWPLTQKVGIIAGLRFEHSRESNEDVLMPRFSLIYQFKRSQTLSFSYGSFYQGQGLEHLRFAPQLRMSKAEHWIASYQYEREQRLLRLEAYYKPYNNLIKYESENVATNNGFGSSKGIDLWFRDRKSIKNADFWISYSFADAQRNYLHYPELAAVDFVARHNFSFVYKHFFSALKSQVGCVWQYNSGRPYHQPGDEAFNSRLTRDYSSLNFNWAYLYRSNIIFYASVNNVLGRENVFGYNYYPGNSGDELVKTPILPTSNRFFFLGIFITLSKDTTKNQLDTL